MTKQAGDCVVLPKARIDCARLHTQENQFTGLCFSGLKVELSSVCKESLLKRLVTYKIITYITAHQILRFSFL